MRLLIYISFFSLLTGLISCESYNQQQESPLRYIPEDAPLILETSNFLSLWNTYSQSSLWALRDENPGLENIYDQMMQLQLLAENNEVLKNSFSSAATFLAISVNNENKSSLLLATRTHLTAAGVEQMIREKYSSLASVTQDTYLETPLYSVIFSEHESILYFAIRDGVLLISYDLPAMKRAFQQYVMKRDLTSQKDFRDVRNTAGQYSDGTVYLNFSNLPHLLLGGSKKNTADS
ncbi:MAG: hypothetical protein U5L09_23160 [Bacteroidales bacterium]|nr:hypothetical protein [Bacteroidales bacterium]